FCRSRSTMERGDHSVMPGTAPSSSQIWRWAFAQRCVVVALDDVPATRGFVAKEFDDAAVHLFVVSAAQQHEVGHVRRTVRPRVDVVHFAPSWLSFAAGHDTALVAHGEHAPLSVAGGVGDLAEVERNRAAGHDDPADGAV